MNNAENGFAARERFSVVIPAHNEAHRIADTLDALLGGIGAEVCAELVVVDDSSTDDTTDIVGRLVADRSTAIPVRIVRVEKGRGKGAAIRAGVSGAQSPVVVLVDADLPVSPGELVALSELVSSADLALGSRRLSGSSFEVPQPVARRVGGLLFRTCARSLGFRGGSDPQCGAKALRVESVGPILASCVSDDFALDAELIERCRRSGRSVVEMPVRWCHRPGSTVRPIRDFMRTVRSLRAARASVLASGVRTPEQRLADSSDESTARVAVANPPGSVRGFRNK